MSNELYEFQVTVETATDAAILVNYDGKEIWLPESQIEYNEVDLVKALMSNKIEIDIEVPEWLAYEKEMIRKRDSIGILKVI